MSHTRKPNSTNEMDPLFFHPSRDPAIHPELTSQHHDQPHRSAPPLNPLPPRRPTTSMIFKAPEDPTTHSYDLRPKR